MSEPDPKPGEEDANNVVEPLLGSTQTNGGDDAQQQQDDRDEEGPVPSYYHPPERKTSRGERKISRKTVVLSNCTYAHVCTAPINTDAL